MRNPSFSRRRRGASRRPRIAGSAEATRALRPRHNENAPVFDKIRQIHGLIPQIHAFFRQIQDPSERGENTKSLKINGLCEKAAPGGGISQGRGICPHLRLRGERGLVAGFFRVGRDGAERSASGFPPGEKGGDNDDERRNVLRRPSERLAFRRHSGEGRNPGLDRLPASGRAPPLRVQMNSCKFTAFSDKFTPFFARIHLLFRG